MGLWHRRPRYLALISCPGCTTIFLHSLCWPETQWNWSGGVWGILAEKQQFAAALFLLHTHSLLHGPAVIRQHILLCHYHQPETLLSARGALQEPAAVEPKEKENLLSASCLCAGVCPLLVTPAGESFQNKLKQNGQLLVSFYLVFSFNAGDHKVLAVMHHYPQNQFFFLPRKILITSTMSRAKVWQIRIAVRY